MTSAKNFVLMASLHRDFGALRESVWRPTLVEGARPVVKKFNEHSPRLFRNANKALKTIPTMLNRPAQDLGAPRSDVRLVLSADAVVCIKVDRNYRSEAAIVKGAAVGKVQ